ncbi:MAG: hypothetical protein DSZ21_00355 [Tenericutes bacterium]|nr:MAG: hypothetical protein DSZ21_00355 [Mycoplasmatota bacterium]
MDVVRCCPSIIQPTFSLIGSPEKASINLFLLFNASLDDSHEVIVPNGCPIKRAFKKETISLVVHTKSLWKSGILKCPSFTS